MSQIEQKSKYQRQIYFNNQKISNKSTARNLMKRHPNLQLAYFFPEPSALDQIAKTFLSCFEVSIQLFKNTQDKQLEETKYLKKLKKIFVKDILIFPLFSWRQQTISVKNMMLQNSLSCFQIGQSMPQQELIFSIKKLQNQLQSCKDLLAQINENNPAFISKLCAQFQDEKEFKHYLKTCLPGNAIFVGNNSDSSHCLILQSKENIYAHHGKTIRQLVRNTQEIWSRFQIQERIEVGQNNNEKYIIEKAKEGFKQLKDSGINLCDCIPAQCETFSEFLKHIYISYTSESYKLINLASTSKNAVVIRGIKYLFQILIKNHRMKIVGEPFFQRSPLYRKITIEKQLLQLYKSDQIIYFTNLTSTSRNNSFFPSSFFPGFVQVTFIIKLLDREDQLKNRFYSGLDITNFSYYAFEQQVLIYPFQFFKICYISSRAQKWQIHLKELQSKQIIEKMEQSASRRKKCEGNGVEIGRIKQILNEEIQNLTSKLQKTGKNWH